MYLGLVFFTDILCHKIGTSIIPWPPFSFVFLHLPPSLKIFELDCSNFCNSNVHQYVMLTCHQRSCRESRSKVSLLSGAHYTKLLSLDTEGNLVYRTVPNDGGSFSPSPCKMESTVKPRFNVPVFNEIPDLMMIFSCPDKSSILIENLHLMKTSI